MGFPYDACANRPTWYAAMHVQVSLRSEARAGVCRPRAMTAVGAATGWVLEDRSNAADSMGTA